MLFMIWADSTLIEKSAGISCQFFLQSSFSAKIGFDDIFAQDLEKNQRYSN